MALIAYKDSGGIIYGQPGTVPRTVVDRGKEVGNMTIFRKLNLETSAYVTGGWPLLQGLTGMKSVFNAHQLAGYDPYGIAIQRNGYQAILDRTTPDGMHSKLMLYYNGAQVADAAMAAAGKYIWVMFIGVS